MATNKDFIVKNGVQATNLALSGNVTSGTWQGTAVSPTYGGTGINNGSNTLTLSGASLTITLTGTTNVTFPTSGTVLTTANASSYGVTSIAGTSNQITASASTGAVTLSLPSSVTTTSLTLSGLTANSFLYSGTGGLLSTTSAPTNGQILIGSTGNPPVAATIATSGSGISVTNAAGSITLANTGVTSAVAGTGISVSGATGAVTIANTGVTSITGTSNQVIASGSTGGVTLSLPQSINTTATPTFNQVTITNAPVAGTDTVNLTYLQSIVAGLEWKNAVAVATTANITLSGEQTIDGVTTSSSRVLVKNQTVATSNGIYVSGSSAWTRSTDANTSSELNNATVFVTSGTTQANTGWTQTTANPTIGTSNIVFTQFSGSGTYTAGTGLSLSGNTFSITNVGTANTYGSASQVPVLTTNAQGQVTAVTNTNIALAGSAITSGTVGVTYGGTGLSGASAANGSLLIGNGFGYSLSTLTAGTGISVTNGSGSITVANNGITSVTGTSNQIATSTVSGVATFNIPNAFIIPGYVQVTGELYLSTSTGISAAGTTLGTATALTSQYNVINTVAAGTGVSLPAPSFGGAVVTIVNRGSNALNVYPQNGSTSIDGAAAGAAVVLPAGATAEYSSSSTSQWYTVNPPDSAGTGISVTYGNGSVTIANTGVTNLATAGSYASALTLSGSIGSVTITPNLFTSTTAGVVPQSGGGSTNYLRADGTWSAPSNTPSLTATYIGYGNGSSILTGTSDFTWTDSTKTLTLGTTSANATITAPASSLANGSTSGLSIVGSTNSYGAGSFGGAINITGGTGSNGGYGGNVNITGGTSSVGGGGAINITGGVTGGVYISAGSGSSSSAAGGFLILTAGSAVGSGAGGNVQFATGLSPSGTAGVIQFFGGTTTTGGEVLVLTINQTGALGFGSNPSYGTSGQILTSAGSGAVPTWSSTVPSSAVNLTSTYIGYGNGSGALTGTSDFTWTDSTQTLVLGNSSGGNISAPSSSSSSSSTTTGVALNLYGGALTSSGSPLYAYGGPVNLIGGTATGGLLNEVGLVNVYASQFNVYGALPASSPSSILQVNSIAVTIGNSLVINGSSNFVAASINSATTSGASGLQIQGGTAATDFALRVYNAAGSAEFLNIAGNGHGQLGPNSTNTLAWNASGGYTIAAPASGNTLTVNGYSNQYPLVLNGSSTSGQSYGLQISAGTTSSDVPLLVNNQANTSTYMYIRGDGTGAMGPHSYNQLSWNSNGSWFIGAASSNANPTLSVSGPVGSGAANFYGSSTTGSSDGVFIQAGTNTSDFAFAIANYANTSQLMKIYGDGSGEIGVANPTSYALSWGATGNFYINPPASGYGLNVNGSNTSTGTPLYIQGNYSGGGYPTMIINDTNNTNGASIQLVGNGSTTPTKYIKALNGNFYIYNNAFGAIMTLTDAGAATFNGNVTASGGQFTANNIFMQGDGSNGYIRATTGVLNLGVGSTNVAYVSSGGISLNTGSFNGSGSGLTGTASSLTANTTNNVNVFNIAPNSTEYLLFGNPSSSGAATEVAYAAGITCNPSTQTIACSQINITSQSISTNAAYYVPFLVTGTVSYNSGFTYNPGTHSLVTSSDRSLKTNIRNIDKPLDVIQGLNGVRFNWKEDDGSSGAPGVGVIAQDVEAVLPELVTEKDGVKGVNYAGLVAPLIEAIKELNTIVAQLKSEIAELKGK